MCYTVCCTLSPHAFGAGVMSFWRGETHFQFRLGRTLLMENALTAAEFQRAGMEVHGKVLQVHGAFSMDR